MILGVWFIFSSPYFVKGRVPFASTYQVNHFSPWSSYENFWGPVKNGAMPDVIGQIYPWRYFSIEQWKKGQIPLWNPYNFGGTPHMANYQSAAFALQNIFFFIFPFVDAWSILVLLQPLLAGAFLYLFVRSLKISNVGSVIASLSFMFCGFITTWMGYGTLPYAILFLPLALFVIEMFVRTHKARYLIMLSLSMPLSFFSGHFQTSLYFFLYVIFYIVFIGISLKSVRLFLQLLLYTSFGFLLAAPQILPAIEFYTQSLRSTLFQSGGGIPLGYLPTILSPDFYGNPVTRNDWYGQYAEWNGYLGVLPVLLAFYTIFRKKNRYVIFFLLTGIITFVFALSTPVLDLLNNLHIPVLSTSAPNRIIVLFSFSFAVLSGFGLDFLLDDVGKKRYKSMFLWLSIITVLFICIWSMILFKIGLPVDKISIARSNTLLPTVFFVVLFGGSLLLFFKRIRVVLIGIFILVVLFDMYRFANKWQAFDPKALVFPNVAVTNFYPHIAGYERVFGNFGAEGSIYYHLPSTEGYDPLYPRRYGQLITSLEDGKLVDAARSVVAFPKHGLNSPKIVNLLNIAYIVHKKSDDMVGWTFPFWTYPDGQFVPIYKDSHHEVYKNTKVYPHAFIASKYSVATSDQGIIDALFKQNRDLRHEVILEENPGISQGDTEEEGSVEISSYQPNLIELVATSPSPAMLFLSDNYYPGWKAYVDGKETKIYRADYTFRSIVVPQGKHSVVFRYEPASFSVGVLAALFGSICMLFRIKLVRKYQ